jgi:hypothetical protein
MKMSCWPIGFYGTVTLGGFLLRTTSCDTAESDRRIWRGGEKRRVTVRALLRSGQRRASCGGIFERKGAWDGPNWSPSVQLASVGRGGRHQ